MQVAIKHPARFEENIVVRQWVDIDIDLEFRAFVSHGRLTALTQYNHMVCTAAATTAAGASRVADHYIWMLGLFPAFGGEARRSADDNH